MTRLTSSPPPNLAAGESIIKFQKTSDRVFGVFPLFDIWERLSASLEAFQAALKVRLPPSFSYFGSPHLCNDRGHTLDTGGRKAQRRSYRFRHAAVLLATEIVPWYKSDPLVVTVTAVGAALTD